MQASDLYAFAIIAWYLFSRGHNFFEQNLGSFFMDVVKQKNPANFMALFSSSLMAKAKSLAEQKIRSAFRHDVDIDLVALLESCWQATSGRRPSFVDISLKLHKLSYEPA